MNRCEFVCNSAALRRKRSTPGSMAAKTCLLAVSLCFASLPTAVGQEIVARSVAPAERGIPEDSVLESPMLLEVPIPWLSSMRDDQRKDVEGLRHFWCEDVRIGVLSFTKHERKKGRPPQWDIQLGLYTRPSYDRDVNVKLEIYRGKEVALRLFERDLEVEEGKSRLVNWKKQEAEFSSEGEPWSIRIVLEVRED